MLTDNLGLPRYWATIWSVLSTLHLKPLTRAKKLRHIEALYSFVDGLHSNGYLDDALGCYDIAVLGDILEAYFVSLRNRPMVNESTQEQWQTGLAFVKDILMRLTKGNPSFGMMAEMEAKLHYLDTLYGQLHIQKTHNPDILRALPAEVVSYLYELLDPVSASNPFSRDRTRWNVFLGFSVLLHQGLRRGELLLLPVDAVKSAFDNKKQQDRHWINIKEMDAEDSELDHRYNKPSIKTADSIRQLPVSDFISNLIQTYVENYRGKPNHQFLLNSQRNTPLSHESLTVYFEKISAHLPGPILKILKDRTGKESITPHDLRHTCAVVRLNQLLKQDVSKDMDEALQKMRPFFGWSRTSDMPRKYARAVFEDRLADVWSNIFDDRVEILRSIPKGQ